MTINYIKLIANGLLGFVGTYINFKVLIENFTDVANGIIGLCVGVITFVYLCYQIKKIRKNLKK